MKHPTVRIILVLSVLAFCVAGTAMAAPSKVTALTIRIDGPVYVAHEFTITGKLTGGPTGVGVGDKLITVSRSTNAKKWAVAGTVWTNAGGYYTLPMTEAATGKSFYRASFAGDKIFKAVTSPSATVTAGKVPTTLTLTSDGYGGLTAWLTFSGEGINAKSVRLMWTADGGNTWELAPVYSQYGENPCITPPEGTCAFIPDLITGNELYKAVFDGDSVYEPSSSATISLF